MPTMIMLSVEEIMERLARLCRLGTSIHCRTTFPSGPSKWYVAMTGVHVPIHTTDMSGASPQDAVLHTWNRINNLPDSCPLVRYFCKPDESIPGKGPQVWVRWNSEKDDWEDVVPPRNSLMASMASEIRPYADHKWMEANY